MTATIGWEAPRRRCAKMMLGAVFRSSAASLSCFQLVKMQDVLLYMCRAANKLGKRPGC